MRRVVLGLTTTACLLVGPAALADQSNEREREILAALATEIEFLDRLADVAEDQVNQQARHAFDYPTLRSKFGEIKEQIDTYLSGKPKQPRQLLSSKQD